MSLPKRTTILIVGAGPTGLSVAISLVKNGVPVSDITIVDAIQAGENSSRAMTIHASTMDMLDSVGCADKLVKEGIQAQALTINDRSEPNSPLVSADFSTLAPYTRFPYVLIIPQNVTERMLLEHAESLGVHVLRPFKAVDIKGGGLKDGTVDVAFESGDIVRASYVIGADGARSVVRLRAGIGFADPDGAPLDDSDSQMIFADVLFDAETPKIHSNRMNAFGSADAFFGVIPLIPSFHHPSADKSKIKAGSTVYRIGCKVPAFEGVPPSKPGTEYLQKLVDKYGPLFLSSDPSVNPEPVKILDTVWSTRFRNHAAVADRFFTRFSGSSEENETGGAILLVGDAAHIHSPAGGMGMNLGIRDAIGLGPVVAQHIIAVKGLRPSDWATRDVDRPLQEYTNARHDRAVSTIRLAKRLLSLLGRVRTKRFLALRNAVIRFIGRLPPVRRAIAWRISGMAFK